MEADLDRLRAEAGVEATPDPTAASGDLEADVAAFTTLDACVKARAVGDPVVADAIESLGYDTLARDACRVVEALKKKDASGCRDIASSALRMRCETGVATVTGNASLCPLGRAGRVEARDPVCLARAGRDERLCAAAIPADQAGCRALTRADPAECGRDAVCRRQVERWRRLVERPKPRAPLPATGKVQIAGTQGDVSLDEIAKAGVLVRKVGGAYQIVLGSPPGPLWPRWDQKGASARLYLDVTASPEAVAKGPVRVTSPGAALELLLPGVGSFSAVTAKKIELTAMRVTPEMGGKAVVGIAAELHDGTRQVDATITVESYVRDVVGH